jgi:hypothetical protein
MKSTGRDNHVLTENTKTRKGCRQDDTRGGHGKSAQENAAGRGLKSRSRSKAAREIWRWKTQLAAKNFQPALLDGHRQRPEAAPENGEENQISCSSRNESGKSGRAPNPRTGSQAATQSRETRAGTECVSQNCNRKMSRAGERPGN